MICLQPDDEPVALRYDVLRKLKSRGEFISVFTEPSPDSDELLSREFETVARCISAGFFYHNRSGYCSGCQWSISCADQPQADR